VSEAMTIAYWPAGTLRRSEKWFVSGEGECSPFRRSTEECAA